MILAFFNEKNKAMLQRIVKYTLSIMIILFTSCEDLDDLGNVNGDPRDKIIDTWMCDENSELYKSLKNTFLVDISKDPNDSSRVLLDNFYNMGLGKSVTARISGSTLTLDQQTVDGFTFTSGSGYISSDNQEIEWTYKVDDGSGIIDNVTATFSRR